VALVGESVGAGRNLAVTVDGCELACIENRSVEIKAIRNAWGGCEKDEKTVEKWKLSRLTRSGS
jgi:hypothetical protein